VSEDFVGPELSIGGAGLEAVAALSSNLIRALVPAMDEVGPKALVFQDPYGGIATVPDAFCVLGPELEIARLELAAPTTVRADEPFEVTFEAKDSAGVRMSFEGEIVVSATARS
jgi:hypothetical protein